MASALRPRIWTTSLNRSTGARTVRDVPGTGLGLTIVRTILEQHGSTIQVESKLHQGTTFRFCLPYAQHRIPIHPPDPSYQSPSYSAITAWPLCRIDWPVLFTRCLQSL